MRNTRGGLKQALIRDAADSSLGVSFMFNPHQYTISLTHQFSEGEQGGNSPKPEITKLGQQQLTLPKVVFDTYEENRDVTEETSKLWDLMAPIPGNENQSSSKSEGRQVIFEWGTFNFKCFIESVKQTYTLFTKEGMPVRAEVDIKLKRFSEPMPNQNPTSGGGPIQKIWRVSAGDRLDTMAAEIYDDPTKWRIIADYNNIQNPLALQPGTELSIPPRQ